jgi:gas vesicle protein
MYNHQNTFVMFRDFIKASAVFAAGAAVGAAVALLLTPKTGDEVREQIKDIAEDAKKRAQEYCEQVKKDIEDFRHQADAPAEEKPAEKEA